MSTLGAWHRACSTAPGSGGPGVPVPWPGGRPSIGELLVTGDHEPFPSPRLPPRSSSPSGSGPHRCPHRRHPDRRTRHRRRRGQGDEHRDPRHHAPCPDRGRCRSASHRRWSGDPPVDRRVGRHGRGLARRRGRDGPRRRPRRPRPRGRARRRPRGHVRPRRLLDPLDGRRGLERMGTRRPHGGRPRPANVHATHQPTGLGRWRQRDPARPPCRCPRSPAPPGAGDHQLGLIDRLHTRRRGGHRRARGEAPVRVGSAYGRLTGSHRTIGRAVRHRAPHRQHQPQQLQLRRGAADPARHPVVPHGRPGLERHRLQLRRRPLRANLGRARWRHRASRDRSARRRVQHRQRRHRPARALRLGHADVRRAARPSLSSPAGSSPSRTSTRVRPSATRRADHRPSPRAPGSD